MRDKKDKKKSYIGGYDQINSYYLGYLKADRNVISFLDSDDFFKKNKYKSINIPKNYKTEYFYLNNDKLMKKINIKNRLIDLEKDCKSISKFF